MAKARLTAKLTNCAGMSLNLSQISGLESKAKKDQRFELVGHSEPGVVFRRLPLIIGEDC